MGGLAERLAILVPGPVRRLLEGFWTVPALIVAAGIGGALGLLTQTSGDAELPGFIADFEPEAARDTLSVVATGVMTAASIVFSLTFVTLSITAQQLSPRILDYVLRDRIMQVMIGAAIATFLFSVISLLGAGNDRRVVLAATASVPMATVTLFLVVLFAFRMTRIIRADEMVARLGAAFVAAMREVSKLPTGCEPVDERLEAAAFEGGTEIRAGAAGYAGTIDFAALMEVAEARELRIALDVRPNDFVLQGQRIARLVGLHPGDEAPDAAVENALMLTERRAPGFDADYEAASLSEAAIRALSPGINDPATARAALNRLFEGLAVLAAADRPPETLGRGGVALILRPVRGLPEFLGEFAAPVAEAAERDSQVTARMKTLCTRLAEVAARAEDRAAILTFRDALERGEPDEVVALPGA